MFYFQRDIIHILCSLNTQIINESLRQTNGNLSLTYCKAYQGTSYCHFYFYSLAWTDYEEMAPGHKQIKDCLLILCGRLRAKKMTTNDDNNSIYIAPFRKKLQGAL